MNKAIMYRQKHASGFPQDEKTQFFYPDTGDDAAPPLAILPQHTSRQTAERIMNELGWTIAEWDSF